MKAPAAERDCKAWEAVKDVIAKAEGKTDGN